MSLSSSHFCNHLQMSFSINLPGNVVNATGSKSEADVGGDTSGKGTWFPWVREN